MVKHPGARIRTLPADIFGHRTMVPEWMGIQVKAYDRWCSIERPGSGPISSCERPLEFGLHLPSCGLPELSGQLPLLTALRLQGVGWVRRPLRLGFQERSVKILMMEEWQPPNGSCRARASSIAHFQQHETGGKGVILLATRHVSGP